MNSSAPFVRRFAPLLAAFFLVAAPLAESLAASNVLAEPGRLQLLTVILGTIALLGSALIWPMLWGSTRETNVKDMLPALLPFWVGLSLVLLVLRISAPASAYLRIHHLLFSLPALIGAALAAEKLWKHLPTPEVPENQSSWRDYLMLTKPIVVSLLLVTTLAAMIVAAGRFPPLAIFLWTALGGFLSAGGASALNQYVDRVRDREMQRTRLRPLPAGRLSGPKAFAFGLLLCLAGFNVLALGVNLISAVIALVGMLYYVLLYSIILKPTTPQNIVIGGGAGAIPPLVGWAAATNSLTMPAFFLFALIFFWTPPHFWALALLKSRDYARAGVPMFPVVYGEQATRVHILLYALQLVAFTVLMPLADLGSRLFLVLALLLGAGFLGHAWRLWRSGTNKLAWSMYRYSSTYLALIFIALVVDTLVRS